MAEDGAQPPTTSAWTPPVFSRPRRPGRCWSGTAAGWRLLARYLLVWRRAAYIAMKNKKVPNVASWYLHLAQVYPVQVRTHSWWSPLYPALYMVDILTAGLLTAHDLSVVLAWTVPCV